MNPRIFTPGATGNPVVQALSLVVAGLVLIGAVVVGAVILAFALGLAVIAALVAYVRLWWLHRRRVTARGSAHGPDPGPGRSRGRTIEVEYQVIDERDATGRRD